MSYCYYQLVIKMIIFLSNILKQLITQSNRLHIFRNLDIKTKIKYVNFKIDLKDDIEQKIRERYKSAEKFRIKSAAKTFGT